MLLMKQTGMVGSLPTLQFHGFPLPIAFLVSLLVQACIDALWVTIIVWCDLELGKAGDRRVKHQCPLLLLLLRRSKLLPLLSIAGLNTCQ